MKAWWGTQEGRSTRGRTFLDGSHSCVLVAGSVDSVVVGSVTERLRSQNTGRGLDQKGPQCPFPPHHPPHGGHRMNSEKKDGPLWLWQVPGQSDFLCPRKAAFLLPNEPGEGLPREISAC